MGSESDGSERSPRESLVAACRGGPITLFLGAGISYSRGVPLWDEVVARLVEWVTGQAGDREQLARAKALVAEHIDPGLAARLALRSHPLEHQLTLEWVRQRVEDRDVRRALARRLDDPRTAAGSAEEAFVAALRRALYENVSRDAGDDALAVAADIIRSEHRRPGGCRLARVVTFNADDLLEREVGSDRVVTPIVRASEHPPAGAPPPIPVYHLHGYLPRDTDDPSAAPDYLVFTDAQFWSTTSNPLSFANRVVANALHDSRCVFAGISMRDVNLMRWLAVRYEELVADIERAGRRVDERAAVTRHFWIHVDQDDPTGVLADILARRGVRSVRLDDWSAPRFRALLHECFGED